MTEVKVQYFCALVRNFFRRLSEQTADFERKRDQICNAIFQWDPPMVSRKFPIADRIVVDRKTLPKHSAYSMSPAACL